MVGAILLLTGFVAVTYGSWRGYGAARSALIPLLRDGDETRSRIEASRPVRDRPRVRLAARHVAFALAWIVVAMYGVFLLTAGAEVLR
jgi:cytochrome oxidase assembly protein ShyY1